jgi:methyltransferase (TIGR00027 family)
MTEPLITGVSDTARWIAAYRALESARPDALFRDPLADRLAGDRGRAIAAAAPRQMGNGWPLVLRTKLVDDLILRSFSEGCDGVLNLAAGLDTRPYRMPVPPAMRWIEADLPALIDEKNNLLAGERPGCLLTRESVDLADAAIRSAWLDRSLEGMSRALVITEGLLGYLDEGTVSSLGHDLLQRGQIRWWMLDLASPAIHRMLNRTMGVHLARAPLRFAPERGIAFFEAMGWKVKEVQSIFREAARCRRLPFPLRVFAIFPDPDPRNPGGARWSGVIRFERGYDARGAGVLHAPARPPS